jgi:hypothetical protein
MIISVISAPSDPGNKEKKQMKHPINAVKQYAGTNGQTGISIPEFPKAFY